MKWILQPQEKKGTYQFNGLFLATQGVFEQLSLDEINAIYSVIKEKVRAEGGLDYLQVFQHADTAQKLFFIDQLNKEMIEHGGFDVKDDHCTLLFPHEY